MKILITGGNTFVPIDKVRGITNIFKGKTAIAIANKALHQEHDVTLLGNKEMGRVRHVPGILKPPERVRTKTPSMTFRSYRTYDELYDTMKELIVEGEFDVIIHSAAVSDYKVNRVLEPAMLDLAPSSVPMGGKISSSYDRLYLELTPTEKIIDKIRGEWGFKGILVKFKLQVDMSDDELLQIAERSREVSDADLMVANCLEWAGERAFILGRSLERAVDPSLLNYLQQIPDTDKKAVQIARENLPVVLLAHIKYLQEEK